MSSNLSELSGRKGLQNNLFERIGLLAQEEGAPSNEKLDLLAKEFLMGTANVYGSATFYDFTREANRGKKVYVCNGSACMTAGTQNKVKESLLQQFDASQIGEMCCLGRCHENHAFYYQGKNYSGQAIHQLENIKLHTSNLNEDEYHVASYGTSVLTQTIKNAKSYYSLLETCFFLPDNDILCIDVDIISFLI